MDLERTDDGIHHGDAETHGGRKNVWTDDRRRERGHSKGCRKRFSGHLSSRRCSCARNRTFSVFSVPPWFFPPLRPANNRTGSLNIYVPTSHQGITTGRINKDSKGIRSPPERVVAPDSGTVQNPDTNEDIDWKAPRRGMPSTAKRFSPT